MIDSVSRRITPSRNSGYLAHLRRELSHGAEIEEDQLAAGADEHVPGVGIGVIEAVDEDLLTEHLDDAPGQLAAVDPLLLHRGDVADLHALDEGRHHHAPGAQALLREGKRTLGCLAKFCEIRAMLRASRRKSSSSEIIERIW